MIDPAIPQELLLPPPRTLRRKATVKLGCVIWSIIYFFLAIDAGVTGWGIVEPILIARANVIDGVVTNLSLSHGSKGATHYHVSYRYPLDGGWKTNNDEVTSMVYRELGMDRPAKVRVFQSGPITMAWLDQVWQHYSSESLGLWIAMGFFNGLLLLWLGSYWRNRELIRNGTPTMGTLVSKRIANGKSVSYFTTFRFQPGGGQAIQKSITVTRQFYDRTNPGDPVCVLYYPGRPNRATLYGASSYVCAGSRDFAA